MCRARSSPPASNASSLESASSRTHLKSTITTAFPSVISPCAAPQNPILKNLSSFPPCQLRFSTARCAPRFTFLQLRAYIGDDNHAAQLQDPSQLLLQRADQRPTFLHPVQNEAISSPSACALKYFLSTTCINTISAILPRSEPFPTPQQISVVQNVPNCSTFARKVEHGPPFTPERF